MIQLPLASVLKSEKPLTIIVTRPVIRVGPGPPAAEKKKKPRSILDLPFSLARGVVRDGEVEYSGPDVGFSVRGLRAVVEPQGGTYILTAEAGTAAVWMDAARAPLEGRLSLVVQAGPQQIKVRRLSLAGREALIRAAGDLTSPSERSGSLNVSYNAEMAAVARLLDIPLDWAGRLEGKGAVTLDRGALSFQTELSSADLGLSGIPLGKASGRVDVLPGRGVSVDLNLLKTTGVELIKLLYSGGRLKGALQGFHLDPIFAYVKLPYPVRSPAWDEIEITGSGLTADFEFRDEDLSVAPPGRYGLRGPCHFTWDMRSAIAFNLPQLEIAFGRVEVDGKIIVDLSADVSIKGEVSDVKGGREFTELVLGYPFEIPEIRGSGQAAVRIFGPILNPDVSMDFNLAPAGYDLFDLSAADGTVLISRQVANGHFRLADPELKGEVDLVSGPDGLDATIKMSEGELARIIPGLSLTYPFSGKAAGEFRVATRGKAIRVEGFFSAPLLTYVNEPFHFVSGRLTWDGDAIAFPELTFDYYGGKVAGSWLLSTFAQVLEIDMAAEDIDLHLLTPTLTGKLSLDMKGRGPLGEKNGAGRFKVTGFLVDPFQPADAEGDLELRLSLDQVEIIAKGAFTPGDNGFLADAVIPFEEDMIAVDVKGGFSNLDLLLPWTGAKGRLNYAVEVRGIPTLPKSRAP